jgi:hypothetical protein
MQAQTSYLTTLVLPTHSVFYMPSRTYRIQMQISCPFLVIHLI